MRLLRLLLIAILAAPSLAHGQSRSRPPDPILGVDKVKHFFVAGFVEAMTFAGLEAAGAGRSSARGGAIGATIVVSIGREVHDWKKKGLFSVRDLVWDALGASAALAVLNRAQR